MSSEKPRLLQPTSPDSEPLWVSTPNLRSTFDLVSSCVLTLLICVWTAIHLNIPKYKERWKGSFAPWLWRRIWWMFMGLIAPELVLYTAWSQFSQAKLVTLRLKKIEDEREYAKQASKEGIAATTASAQHDDPDDYEYDVELARKGSRSKLLPRDPEQEKLSRYQRLKNTVNPHELERGYYAIMGGLELVIGKEQKYGEWRDIRRTLTPCGVLLLARLGLLPPLSVTVINDKSKADLLTKTLVCIQACWMLVQAMGRKVEGLPITLLELNTIMHVCCALAMYLLWFKKPQDVGTPTLVHDRHRTKPLGALLNISAAVRSSEDPNISSSQEALATLKWRDGIFEYKHRNQEGWTQIWDSPSDREASLKVNRIWIYDVPGKTSTILRFPTNFEIKKSQVQFIIDYATGKIATFGKAKVEWAVFCEEIQRNGSHGYTKKASNFQLVGQIKSEKTADTINWWMAISVGPAIYGGIHLTPWNAHFPTHLERYLWRFSGFSVALGLPTIVVLFTLADHALDTMNPFKIPFRAFKWVMSFRPKDAGCFVVSISYPLLAIIGLGVWALVAGFGATLIVMVLMYPLTRLYILAEAFASLRNLPKGAYSTVGWAEMFPHF